MKLEMTQKQELKLTPQMLQSMELLQMSAQELEAYLQELVQENPAAELSEPEERQDEGEELWRRMQSLADQDNQNRQYVAAEREELDPLARIGTDGGLEDTLLLHLSRQLERSQAPTLVLRGAQFLAACLDESGYLREEVENLAQAAGLPAAVLEEGLSLLQTLDPAGVGARDLSQCLELQLRRAGEEGTALAVVQRGLERLARRQQAFFQSPGGSLSPLRLADIAAELSIHESTVSRAVREKYLQCARGVYPLSFFFTREVGAGEGQSAHEIKNQLLRLIREEDKRRPCSDEKLRQLLAVGGYAVSRRTVAKYREELEIPSAAGRRA